MKGVREIRLQPTGKPNLIGAKVTAYELRLDQMDSYEWLGVEQQEESEEEGGQDEGNFFATLRQVSQRKTKPSSPGGALSET